MIKPKITLHIVGGAELFLHPFLHWNKGAMFVNSNFGCSKYMYWPTLPNIYWQSWGQSCKVSIGSMALSLLK